MRGEGKEGAGWKRERYEVEERTRREVRKKERSGKDEAGRERVGYELFSSV